MDEHGNTGQHRHSALVAVTSSRALMPGAPAGPVGPAGPTAPVEPMAPLAPVVKELVTLVDQMNAKQPDSKLDAAYELVKVRDEQDQAASVKMLWEFIPTLVNW